MKDNKILSDMSNKSNPFRKLDQRKIWLWTTRGIYVVLFLIVLQSQIFGIVDYFRETQFLLFSADIDISIEKLTAGQFIVADFGLDNYTDGIEKGDMILEINDIHLTKETTIEDIDLALSGSPGEAVKLGVQKSNGDIQEYTVIRWKPLVDTLKKYHLEPNTFFWLLFGVVSSLMLGSTLISLFIFFARTTNWVVILFAISLLFLPATLNEFSMFFDILGGSPVTKYGFFSTFGILGLFFGPPLLLLAIYLFPDGRLTPPWIKWILPAFLFAHPLGANAKGLLFSWFGLSSWIWIVSLLGGIVTQIYRYRNTYAIMQKQQIKWALMGFLGILFTATLSELLARFHPGWWVGGEKSIWENVFLVLRNFILLSIPLLFSSIALAISIYRYKLWDADFYINRVIVYSLVTGVIAITLIITVTILQNLLQQLDSQVSPLLIAVLSSIQVTTLFKPIRTWVEKWVNERFYKDRVNFVEAIVELQPEKWQFISTTDMLQLLVNKTPSLIKSTGSAIYLVDNKGFDLVSSFGVDKKEVRNLVVDPKDLENLKKRKVIEIPNKEPFVVLVPLTVPRGHENDLIGILALGARESSRGYSRDHISDLADLGKSAGVAIHFLQLSKNKANS